MKGKDVIDALGGIDEKDVHSSAPVKRKSKKKLWISAVAAVLVIAITAGILLRGGRPQDITPMPGGLKAYAVAAPTYPESVPYPANEFGDGMEEWSAAKAERRAYRGKGSAVLPFADRLAAAMLGDRNEKNTVFSPVSVFLAAAMLAELTDGSTRSQILDALGVDNIETLRQTAYDVWNANYSNDGATTSILGSSVWLDQDVKYNNNVLQTLAERYFASSFSGSFAEKKYVEALQSWVNEQTGDLLADAVKGIDISPDTVFALLSTVLFRAKWNDEFNASETRQGIFYAPQGEQTADFMHATFDYGTYYWGKHFGAVSLSFKEGGSMWFFLPDEGTTPDQLFTDPEALSLMHIAGDWQALSEWQNQKSLRINLALPKFDISSDVDLNDTLEALGISDCFKSTADFTPLTDNEGVFVSQVKHAARVAVDEEGVIATAFTAIIGAGAAMPPEEEMDFVLNRPFAFLINGLDTVPLFEGTVWDLA